MEFVFGSPLRPRLAQALGQSGDCFNTNTDNERQPAPLEWVPFFDLDFPKRAAHPTSNDQSERSRCLFKNEHCFHNLKHRSDLI
jgi:hypothetical protein